MNQKEAFNKVFDQFTEEEKYIVGFNRFAYLFAKAWMYIKMGPVIYRKHDALKQPSLDYNEHDLAIIEKGCQQVLEGIGMTKEKPFTGLETHFNILFELFHFKLIQSRSQNGFNFNGQKGTIVCAKFQHMIDGTQIVYYNWIENPSNNDLPF